MAVPDSPAPSPATGALASAAVPNGRAPRPEPAAPVVWVVGASSGIGEGLAREWFRRGARLVLSARREDRLRALAAELTGEAAPAAAAGVCGGRAAVLPLDLEDSPSFAGKAAAARAFFGRVDVLALAGGVSQRSKALETPEANTRRIMETNFFGPVALARAAVPPMLADGGGRVVVVSSLMGKFGAPGRSSYAASKHALHGYFDALRAEEWQNGLRVTLVTPGYVKTEISLRALTPDGAAHGALDPGQANGMSPAECARQVIDGVEKGLEEILIGGREKYAVFLKRWAPKILSRILRGRNVD